jgi:hypothetical protein
MTAPSLGRALAILAGCCAVGWLGYAALMWWAR